MRSVPELQALLPVYLAVHLHEALLFGAGPTLTTHLRLAEASSDESDFDGTDLPRSYIAGGLGSTLMASF